MHQACAVFGPTSSPALVGRALPGLLVDLAAGWDEATGEPRWASGALGSSGEIVVGGPTVARGYLGRPALSAEKFVASAKWGRLYRTGDLGVRAEGGIELLGRSDGLVKARAALSFSLSAFVL